MDTPEATAGLRARRRALTERDIEDAALSAFEADGFEATTMDRIAARAEVSVRTAFRYFPSKVDTVLFSARRAYEIVGACLRTGLQRGASLADLEDSIAGALATLVESDPEAVGRLKRLRTLMLGDDRLRGEVAKSEGYLAGLDALEFEVDDNSLRARLTVEIVAATLRSAFDAWAATASEGEELVDAYARAREVRVSLMRD